MNIVQTYFNYRNALIPLNLNKVLFLIVHHIDAINASPEDIHQWHLEFGWSGFGYNEYITKDGTVYIGRGDNVGAQTANMNSKSYGIAVEGNYDKETYMPQAQYDSLVERLRFNKLRFPNLVEIAPHSKFTNTSCPGQFFPMQNIINDVNDNSYGELSLALDKLHDNGIINTPEYWELNAQEGKYCKGEYVQKLIINMANRL